MRFQKWTMSLGCIALLAALTLPLLGQEPGVESTPGQAGQPSTQPVGETSSDIQKRVLREFTLLEKTLQDLATFYAKKGDHKNAALIHRALKHTGEEEISTRIKRVLSSLTGGKHSEAGEVQTGIISALTELLRILTPEDKKGENEAEQKRIKALIAKLKALIGKQKLLIYQEQRGGVLPSELVKIQEEIARETEILKDIIDGQDRSKSNQSGKSKFGDENIGDQIAGTDTQGERRTGDNRAGDTDIGKREAGDSESGDSDAGDSDAGDTDIGDTKSGDTKIGKAKTGDSKTGHTKKGDTNIGNTKNGSTEVGDTDSGDTDSGDSTSGDNEAGDSISGDNKSGDSKTGDSKNGDSKTGDSISGDSQSGDNESGDSESGDSESGDSETGDSETGDSTSGDSKSGNTKSGDSKSGDSKSGDSTSGDSKTGDSESGDSQSGDSKSGDSKTGDSTKGDTKAGDSKTGNSKKGDSETGDSESGDSESGSSQSGDSDSGDTESGNSKAGDSRSGDSKSGDSKSPDTKGGDSISGDSETGSSETGDTEVRGLKRTPGRNEIAEALKKMQDAIERLRAGDLDEASKLQDGALAELQDAEEKLREILKQLREEEHEMLLQDLADRFKIMIGLQRRVLRDTVAIDSSREEKGIDAVEARAIQLAGPQEKITQKALATLKLLQAEGSSTSFPVMVEGIYEDMQEVTRLFLDKVVGQDNQEIQRDIIEALDEGLMAFVKELESKKDKKKKKSGDKKDLKPKVSKQQDPKLVEKLAELKMLRSLQMRINRKTRRLGHKIEGEGQVATDTETARQLKSLSKRQARIHKAAHDLVKGNNN